MIDTFRKLFRPGRRAELPAVPPGQRVYAIGDIHGRCDLFAEIIEMIERDDAMREPAETTVVLLGDLIDRGPDSAGVIAAARAWQQRKHVRIITGNHEEMFFESFLDIDIFGHFIQYGGRETILSYSVDAGAFDRAELTEAQAMMIAAVARADLDYVAGFEDFVVIGDYLFVHAGIRPGTPLEAQQPRHLRWIREPFLSHRGHHGHFVVHGHTITDEPDLQSNRIGLDTGAYLSGKLTAICLQGTQQWLMQTGDPQHEAAAMLVNRQSDHT